MPGAGGGGVLVRASAPTIRDNVIIGNATEDFGGAILSFDGGAPVIIGNRIEGNDRRALIIGIALAVVGTILFFVLVASLIGDPEPVTTTLAP